MIASKTILRGVALLTLCFHLAGCGTWRPAAGPPSEVIRDGAPSPVRITTTDGRVVVVDEPRIEEDAIVGLSEVCEATRGAQLRSECVMELAIVAGLFEVETLEVRETDVLDTALLVAGGAVVVGWLVGLAIGFIDDG